MSRLLKDESSRGGWRLVEKDLSRSSKRQSEDQRSETRTRFVVHGECLTLILMNSDGGNYSRRRGVVSNRVMWSGGGEVGGVELSRQISERGGVGGACVDEEGKRGG